MLPRYLCYLALLLTFFTNSTAQEFLQHRESTNLTDWKFYKGDTSYAYNSNYVDLSFWEDVKIPHTWNSKDVNEKGPQYYQGIGWYRTKFHIIKKKGHERFFLRFEGVSLIADIFINGNHVGQHKGGYSAFTYEITQYVQDNEENTLAVKVDNSSHYEVAPSGSYNFPIFGGIYRPVTLFSTSETCISPHIYGSSGIYIHPGKINKEQADFSVNTIIHQNLSPVQTFTGSELKTEYGKPGLTTSYFDNENRSGSPIIIQNESRVFIDVGPGSPEPNIPKDFFSVRWKGQFVPHTTGTYTFYTRSDDGSWLYLENKLLINNGGTHSTKEKSESIHLTAGKKYPLQIDYTEEGGQAYMRFGWVFSPDTDKEESYTLETRIMDENSDVVLTKETPFTISKNGEKNIEQNFSIPTPHLWNAKKDPYLYTLRVNLLDSDGKIIDSIDQPLGLRTYHIDKEKGLILNGQPYNLYGVCQFEDWKNDGTALSKDQYSTDFSLIQEIGANGVRLTHYQQADIVYSLCDKAGLVVWTEIPNTPMYHYSSHYLESCTEQLKELIFQNYNHPSIFFWGLYNEVPIPSEDVEHLNKIAHQIDPHRLTTQTDNVQVHERHSITDVTAWNWFFGWYYDSVEEYANWYDDLHLNFPEIKGGLGAYGASACISQQEENPNKPNPYGKFFPEQFQRKYHEDAWKILKTRDDIWCKFVWNMFDFNQSTISRGDQPYLNHKGLITHDHKTKKDAFYFYKANWSDEPVVYINSRRNTERHNEATQIEVYTNTEFATLYVNGKRISEQGNTSDINKITWPDIKLKPGRNYISVIGKNGSAKYTDSCVWTYIPD
jgi:fibro-slime domain-containing protein